MTLDLKRISEIIRVAAELHRKRSQLAQLAEKARDVELLELELKALVTGEGTLPMRPPLERAQHGERRDQILALAREGLDRKQIRQRTGLPHHIVNATLRRLRETGKLSS